MSKRTPSPTSSTLTISRRHSTVRGPMPEVFHQIYNPVGGSVLFSALVASVPPLLLALLLAVLRVAPWRAAVAAAIPAAALAWLGWGMPLPLTIAAATHGMAFGLWPI